MLTEDVSTLICSDISVYLFCLRQICEIPYAKYLDCGFDQFEEAAIAHWLSNGQSLNGMLIRLQGFDRGLFGGNFHTHNTVGESLDCSLTELTGNLT